MTGGLFNLVSEGQQNIILNGNPSKTFYKTTYKKYTNFGLQKFRVDYEGAKTLLAKEDSYFTFKIPRYADLLMDCYLSMTLPDIWSTIVPPIQYQTQDGSLNYSDWSPYEFKWIENIGALAIRKITITCGNQKLQEFSGQYILSMAQRDFPTQKLQLFYEMIGNIPELNDPAFANMNGGNYPNAFYTSTPGGAEPSIRGRTLYIPLNAWFNLKTQLAFPLVSLQYNELQIQVEMRPIYELYRIRDVYDIVNNYPYVQPNFNTYYMQMYRFLQTPPDIELQQESYIDTRNVWNADIYLNCTYCFLSNDEAKLFAKNQQNYLFKQIHESVFYNVTGPNKIQLDSIGIVSNWMFYFQRSDANLRNEWSNYTNWTYKGIPPSAIIPAPPNSSYVLPDDGEVTIGPGLNPTNIPSGLYITGNASPSNQKYILQELGILLDGQYRENLQPDGVFNYIEKYTRTEGNAPEGLYCYNFCLNTSPFETQPSGALNTNRFNLIEFEFTTIYPPLDPNAQSLEICDPQSGELIAVNKPSWRIYKYNYDMMLFEERYNMLTFVGGNCGLMYAT